MRDLLMTFKTFKKYCKKRYDYSVEACDVLYQHQYIQTIRDKDCRCNKRNCPVVKRTRL